MQITRRNTGSNLVARIKFPRGLRGCSFSFKKNVASERTSYCSVRGSNVRAAACTAGFLRREESTLDIGCAKSQAVAAEEFFHLASRSHRSGSAVGLLGLLRANRAVISVALVSPFCVLDRREEKHAADQNSFQGGDRETRQQDESCNWKQPEDRADGLAAIFHLNVLRLSRANRAEVGWHGNSLSAGSIHLPLAGLQIGGLRG